MLFPVCYCLFETLLFSGPINSLYKNIDMEKYMMDLIQIHLNQNINLINIVI